MMMMMMMMTMMVTIMTTMMMMMMMMMMLVARMKMERMISQVPPPFFHSYSHNSLNRWGDLLRSVPHIKNEVKLNFYENSERNSK